MAPFREPTHSQDDLSHTRPYWATDSLTEGDLIIVRKNLSAIGTLVERTSNYTMLLHLPDGYTPEQVRDALTAKIKPLPEVLRASLTWDQGPEMGLWKKVAVHADIDIYFCDPHAPWQRATNETPTVCSVNTFRLAATSPCTAPTTSTGSPPSSTTGHANA